MSVKVFLMRAAMSVLAATSAVRAGDELARHEVFVGDDRNQPAPGAEMSAALSGAGNCFVSTTITPNLSLPDGNPGFTCFDMPLTAPPSAVVADVEVVVGHDHSWAGDLVYQLWHPDGAHVTMLHRPGRSGAGFGDSSTLLSSSPIVFGDGYTDDAETMGNTIDGDGVICQDDGRCEYFPNADEDLTSLAGFAGLAGEAAAGTWQFCASDNAVGDTGPLNMVKLDLACTAAPDVCAIGSWQSVAPLNTARSRVGLVYSPVTGRFYLLGGEGAGGDWELPIEEYDHVSDTWTEKSQLLTGVSNTGAAAVGAYIYVPGGWTGASAVDDMQRYDPVVDVVAMMAPMPDVNHAHAVAALDGKVYVLGGSPTGAAGTTNYLYDAASNSWGTRAALPMAVQYPAAATDGNYIYVIGGDTADLATVQRYNPATNSWDTLTDMNTGRGGASAFFDGFNLWAVGGGWSSYHTSTEYGRHAAWWQNGPELNVGARSLGAAYGDGIALKAAGWNGTYANSAEVIGIDCPDTVFADRFEN